MTDLPDGWRRTTMGEVCDVVSGSTPRTSVAENWDGDIAWITPDDLSRHREKVIYVGARSITKLGYASCSTTMVPKGTVLYTTRAPIGYAAIAGQPVCTNQGFKNFVPGPDVGSEYLYWYLRHSTPQIRDMGSGTTFKEVSKKVAKSIPLILPPLDEQHRIVAAIEEQLSRLDAALDSLQAGLKKTASLERSGLRSLLDVGHPDWATAHLGEVCSVEWGNTSITKAQYVDSGVTAYSASGPDGFLPFAEHSGPGIVVSAIGARCGRCFWAEGEWTAIKNTLVIKAGADREVHLPFVYRVVNRLDFWPRSGSGQPFIALGKARETTIPVPRLEDQRRIADEVQALMDRANATRDSARSGLVRASGLRAAILRDAFSGTLTSPPLIEVGGAS